MNQTNELTHSLTHARTHARTHMKETLGLRAVVSAFDRDNERQMDELDRIKKEGKCGLRGKATLGNDLFIVRR